MYRFKATAIAEIIGGAVPLNETSPIIILRTYINDIVEPYTYSDARLVQLLTVSAYLIIQTIDFGIEYSVDLSTNTISPDPNNDYISLTVLKAIALLAESEWKTESRKGMTVRDGPTAIDARPMLDAKAAYVKYTKEQLDRAILIYQAGNRCVGTAIIGPSRFEVGYGSQPKYY